MGLGLPCHSEGLGEIRWSAELSTFISRSPNLSRVVGGWSKHIFKATEGEREAEGGIKNAPVFAV